MWVGFIFLCFLLILLVSMLFSASNRFVCYFRLLNFTPRKTYWIQFTPVKTFSKSDCPLVWHCSPPLCKNHKKPEADKKIQVSKTLPLTESFVFSWCRCSKQSVSRLTMNWSEHFIWWGFFQIFSGNNNTSLLLYACEVIHFVC